MNDVLAAVMTLSLAGSVLALLFMALRMPLRNRLSQTWQYYIWLVVLLRFLIPFYPQATLLNDLFVPLQNTAATTTPAPESDMTADRAVGARVRGPVQPVDESGPAPESGGERAAALGREILHKLWIVWLGAALALFAHKVITFRRGMRFARAGAREIDDEQVQRLYLDELALQDIQKRGELLVNEQIASTMLIGWLRPAIVLQGLHLSEESLRYIIRHELIHFRRRDYLYKWLVQAILCLHWFNPVAYAVSRRIDKSCELSCDEAVIRQLDGKQRMRYGDALMASLRMQGVHSRRTVSLPMSEDAQAVKERLHAIACYKKRARAFLPATALLTAVLLSGFTFAGSVSATALGTAGNAPVAPLPKTGVARPAGPSAPSVAEASAAEDAPPARQAAANQVQEYADRDKEIQRVDIYADVVNVVLRAGASDTFSAVLSYPEQLDVWYSQAQVKMNAADAAFQVEVVYPGGEIPQVPGLHTLATLTVQIPQRQYDVFRLVTLAASDGGAITIPVQADRVELVNVAGDVSYQVPYFCGQLDLNNKAGNVSLRTASLCAQTNIASKAGEVYYFLPGDPDDVAVDFRDIRMGAIRYPSSWPVAQAGADGAQSLVRGTGEKKIHAEMEIGTLHLSSGNRGV